MNDQCKHCQMRGDIDRCRVTDCSIHETWYAKEQTVSLHHSIRLLKEVNDALHGFAPLTESKLIGKADRFIKEHGQ